jgi:CBS-domain-containing membrane protein
MITDAAIDEGHTLDQLLGTVADAMQADVLVLDMDTPADVAAHRLERAGVSGAPVVRRGRVVGVVTLRDLFGAIAIDDQATRTTGPFLRHERARQLPGWRADDPPARDRADALAPDQGRDAHG